jgi:hypothetical protein
MMSSCVAGMPAFKQGEEVLKKRRLDVETMNPANGDPSQKKKAVTHRRRENG